ncbi:RNA methyltransferase [Synechococcus sp. Cruz-9H2]|uniref:RNA methyltransferase n=1 Tax=unclassified Synechococcus TaxID=2626047 RepID=UPI0020CEDBE2|nr:MULTISPECIES: RNA methyltransferase [unclassified Synechococcus]MCP9818657.1 RNA methyltransferase [Synechococcus sp. Cruz-9H2]MCP9842887.1 RNA methyltransferase [Synechococcus sp. Edmonson 11F2]MCP9855912.1 RNA methyltransferase [Synechococcus sp. Cruz-9C9]MCP9862201.1 RNA methyltransferase [Synechococcus sp. Cruz-7E5]MCP9869472.1 RNA methyltransferase [Synechococcus sp. Cruz-7B9]
MRAGSAPECPELALVLVEPAGPLNVGSVARLCANFALHDLRLVAPRCDHLGEEARRMAVHAGALLEGARVYPDLASAIADRTRVVAANGRVDSQAVPIEGPAQAIPWLLGHPSPSRPEPARRDSAGALVFGREDRGLSTDELLQAGRILRIGTDACYPSLNLSHAVAITLHELRRCQQGDSERRPGGPAQSIGPEPAARELLEAALADAEELLLEVGFVLPHTAHARMAKLRALLQRAQISAEEVALVRGMVRQLRWASQRGTP